MMFNPVGSLVGAGIKTFLLESSRVVSQQKGEKNYHVFYELLAGMEEEVAGIPHVVSKPQKQGPQLEIILYTQFMAILGTVFLSTTLPDFDGGRESYGEHDRSMTHIPPYPTHEILLAPYIP
jgi:hypothetical protein